MFVHNTKPHRSKNVSAIFVHAGAGYHSHQNERTHLEACNDAAKAAMAVLRQGGTAVDAVEVAVKILEDREITNAGYGSNLAMDGVVECDASIVDHFGRSGAVGAIAQVRNPISVARLILDQSTKPLSLRRVPPNFLVGQGATDFANKQGIPVLPHDALISESARDRWKRWRADLRHAERFSRDKREAKPTSSLRRDDAQCEEVRRNHTEQLIHQTPREILNPPNLSLNSDHDDSWNTQKYSPGPGSSSPEDDTDASANRSERFIKKIDSSIAKERVPPGVTSSGPRTHSQSASQYQPTDRRSLQMGDSCDDFQPTSEQTSSDPLHETDDHSSSVLDDNITDTVGAIAIDCYGNVACGSSSGGIGMKHRGRVGPAALVGVGSAVVTVDPEDTSNTCVAIVTSGTGEHMATTMAATVCAERLYYNLKKTKTGAFEMVDGDSVIRSVIENEFLGHPSVRHGSSAGAIGILGVKKDTDSIHLYFAHNTDSFALASMHSDEQEPLCAMSRSRGNGSIAQGGRPIRLRRKK